ncbi:cytochrome-c peroxidase [Parasalinivibrio latis]|uniref:cytochrome-c peroxidase n=1 Tax=Parasalinivibrio latis TaxID=2952610 RepID=UPI0030E1C948
MASRSLPILVIFTVFMAGVVSADENLRNLANKFFGTIPEVMPGGENDTIEKIELGEKLYFEIALSVNKSQSCNTCHNILNGGSGTDNLKTSVGALGIIGRRNSLTTWNAGFQFAQFWDARASDLEEQAKFPLLNPNEMALPSEDIAVQRLEELGYSSLFQQAFSEQRSPLNFDNIGIALSAFQRTLITHDRFDDFQNGDDDALTHQEKDGLQTFVIKGCNACHNGPLMGGKLLIKMGLVKPYPNKDDKGRAEVTGNPAHNFLFKVPPLRNVAQTYPYFHDGAGETLEQAVRDTGWHQLGVRLSEKEIDEISAFLRALDNTRLMSFKDK